MDGVGNAQFGFQAMRHAAASQFFEQNWPPKKIRAVRGHSSTNMTMDVSGYRFEGLEEDVELFAKMEQDLMAA